MGPLGLASQTEKRRPKENRDVLKGVGVFIFDYRYLIVPDEFTLERVTVNKAGKDNQDRKQKEGLPAR